MSEFSRFLLWLCVIETAALLVIVVMQNRQLARMETLCEQIGNQIEEIE